MMETLAKAAEVAAEAAAEVAKNAEAAEAAASGEIDPDARIEAGESDVCGEEVADIDPDARIGGDLPEEHPTRDVSEERRTGGTYGELKKEWSGELESPPPREVHHMPANDVNGLKDNDGPAIVMDKADHRQTASCGNSREAREYRQRQKELIDAGKFEEAMQMDIDDIHDKFGDKYDDAIAQMKQSAKEKGII